MGSNEILIVACVGGFVAANYYIDRKRIRHYKRKRISTIMPDIHTDSLDEDTQPMLLAAHPAAIGKGTVKIVSDNDNASFFIWPDLTAKPGEETMSVREYSTGRAPHHLELMKGPKPEVSAIPWVQNRSHVAAENFLKYREGLMHPNEYSGAVEDYHDFWPEPKQHPYQ
jgi:hypothetical protein